MTSPIGNTLFTTLTCLMLPLQDWLIWQKPSQHWAPMALHQRALSFNLSSWFSCWELGKATRGDGSSGMAVVVVAEAQRNGEGWGHKGMMRYFLLCLRGNHFQPLWSYFHWLLKMFSVDQNFLPHHWPENVENIVRRIFSIETNRM